MTKKYIVPIITIIGLASFVVLGNSPALVHNILETLQNNSITNVFLSGTQTGFQKSTGDSAEKTYNPNAFPEEIQLSSKENVMPKVPETVLWRVIFSIPEKLEKAAEKARTEGQDDSLWINYFVRQAGLSNENNQILKETASVYSGEIVSINERAKQIIEEIRANNPKPDGENGKSVSRFKPPTELTEFQKQKDKAALRYRDNFKAAIGEEAFSVFEKWVLEEFSKNFTVTDDKSPALEDTTRQLPQNNGFTPLNEAPKREIIINGGETNEK